MKRLFKNKAFYMLLGLAISVVTVNSFLGRINNLQKDFEIETPKTEITKEFEMPQPKKLSPVKPVIVEEPEEQPQPVETKPVVIELPLQGELLNEHSQGELVYNKTMEDWRTHNGIDIGGEAGEAVKASADGEVSFVGFDGLNGFTVIIDHGGFKTKYCGLQESDIIKENTKVKTGDVIGGVGVTNENEASERPHLHFELIVEDKSVNPLEFVENIML